MCVCAGHLSDYSVFSCLFIELQYVPQKVSATARAHNCDMYSMSTVNCIDYTLVSNGAHGHIDMCVCGRGCVSIYYLLGCLQSLPRGLFWELSLNL